MVCHSNRTFGASLLALVLAFVVSSSVNVQAQVAGGAISGTVSDTSGRVIAGAQVSITKVDTGVSRTTSTNEDGTYSAPNLLPGNYELTLSAAGFKTEVRHGVAVTVGSAAVLDLTLQVGRTIETIQVTGEAPAVQLSTSDISAVVNATTVRELPLNGRSRTTIVWMASASTIIQTGLPAAFWEGALAWTPSRSFRS